MMRVIAIACLLVLAAFLPAGFVSAQSNANTDCGETTLEIDACVQSKLAATDHLLNEVYDIVIREISAGTDDPNPLFNSEIRTTLIEAERQWVKFKDAQCRNEAALVAPGTAMAAVDGQCLIDLSLQRIRFLRRVAEQTHWNSKLCRAEKASCVLPADPSGS
jgi:uncharacterized protein YecT (DUF1311 family)